MSSIKHIVCTIKEEDDVVEPPKEKAAEPLKSKPAETKGPISLFGGDEDDNEDEDMFSGASAPKPTKPAATKSVSFCFIDISIQQKCILEIDKWKLLWVAWKLKQVYAYFKIWLSQKQKTVTKQSCLSTSETHGLASGWIHHNYSYLIDSQGFKEF